jgi:hypothetical protein
MQNAISRIGDTMSAKYDHSQEPQLSMTSVETGTLNDISRFRNTSSAIYQSQKCQLCRYVDISGVKNTRSELY